MRYVSGFLYALAIASGTQRLLDGVMIAACVFLGTVALVFAIEGVVRDVVERRRL